MKQRLISVLLNQYVITFLIALSVLLVLPVYVSKYKIEFVQQEKLANESVVYFQDLNNDGNSEKIVAITNALGNASYMIFDAFGDLVDQYNYSTLFPNSIKDLSFGDIDQNGFKELYLLTHQQDSIFLNIHEPFAEKGINVRKLFVDFAPEFNGAYEFRMQRFNGFQKPLETEGSFTFSIMSGFSGSPRNVYKYDYNKNTIIKSPHITNSFGISELINLDNDQAPEVILKIHSSGNTIDTSYTKRSDYKTWLTVLDDDLSFKFQPLEFDALGAVNMKQFVSNKQNMLFGIFKSRQQDIIPTHLFVLSPLGKIIKKKEIPQGHFTNLIKLNNDQFSLYERSKGRALIYNTSLELIKDVIVEPNAFLYYVDVDYDKNKDWVSLYIDRRSVAIYEEDFKNKTTYGITETKDEYVTSGIVKKADAQNQLYFQHGPIVSILEYNKNKWYAFRFLYYIGVYGLILLLVALITKGQKLREAKQRAIEQQISELQIKTVKNQVDPHFVFNAINTISEMTLMDNKLEADKFISRFSGFMRDTLQHSDKISTTLEEELQYTENFIKLQQIRFNHKFNYNIHVDKKVDKKVLVPKHVLFTYVENAIKHGLALTVNGTLTISVKKRKEDLFLIIEDNGMGIRESNEPKAHSTGNGLLIMKKIFSLYTKLTKRKITHHITNKKDVDGNTSGVRIDICISKPKQ